MALVKDKKLQKQVGQKINKIRKEKNISFGELALRAEMEKPNLVKLTTEGTNITITTLYKIAKALGVSAKELLP